MTIQELIETLSQYNPNTLVVIGGYQAGYNDISKIELVNLQLNVNHQWYYGSHSLAPLNNPTLATTSAIYLGGYNPNYPISNYLP